MCFFFFGLRPERAKACGISSAGWVHHHHHRRSPGIDLSVKQKEGKRRTPFQSFKLLQRDQGFANITIWIDRPESLLTHQKSAQSQSIPAKRTSSNNDNNATTITRPSLPPTLQRPPPSISKPHTHTHTRLHAPPPSPAPIRPNDPLPPADPNADPDAATALLPVRDKPAALHGADGRPFLLAGPGAQLAEPARGHGGRVDVGAVLVGGQFLWVRSFLLFMSSFLFFSFLLTTSPPPLPLLNPHQHIKSPQLTPAPPRSHHSRILLLLLLIARSKLVPDFALTLHLIHLVVTSLYSRSVPTNGLWWALQAASAALMVAGGVWTCRWRELRPIAFGKGGKDGGGGGRGEYEMVAREEGGEGGEGDGDGQEEGRR